MNDPLLWFWVAFFCSFLGIIGSLMNRDDESDEQDEAVNQ